ncbi:MAG: FAD-dependent monooxygenase [Vicinamibacterales bacterium]|nr:FAD-dependent monooxygenase [Vicinamibacterales bacterium]
MTVLAPPRLAPRYDAVIIGARCAGAATARLLARAGLRVLVADRGRHGTDTLSTHALMRAGVLQLHRWGVLPAIQAAGTPVVRRATFTYGADQLPVPIKPRDGVEGLYAPRRRVLDRVLVDAALAAGAVVEYGLRLIDLLRSLDGRVVGAVLLSEDGRAYRVETPLVIGADGVRSTVAHLVDAPVTRAGHAAAGVVYGYWARLPVDGYRWYFQSGASAGAIPTNDEETCVFAVTPADRFAEVFRGDVAAGYRRVIAEAAPELVERLRAAELRGTFHGFPGLPGYFRRSAGPGWALVGDAGCFKDPITAHGITDALIAAELLATAVVAGSDAALAQYEASRNAMATPIFDVTERIASFAWTLAEVRGLHRTLSEEMAREVTAMAAHNAAGVPA